MPFSGLPTHDSVKKVEIDGSFGEGGGQIIRNAVTLACILQKKIQVVNIRANRPNPGLASQHLQSILALLRLTGARTTATLRKGLTAFDLDATGEMNGEFVTQKSKNNELETTIDLKTAGSITLCIQCILPCFFSLPSPTVSRVTIIGGTHVMKAPNTDYMHRVFIPTLNQLGYHFDIDMLRAGYFPRGGGRVILRVKEGNEGTFHPFNLTERGSFVGKSAILNLTPPLYEQNQMLMLMSKVKSITKKDILINQVNYVSVEYFLKYEKSALGFYRLIEGRPPKPSIREVQDAIESVEEEFGDFFKSTVCVDNFLQDQLIIYMTLAKLQNPDKVSQFTTMAPLTDHTLSAIHVSQLITGLTFDVIISQNVAHISL